MCDPDRLLHTPVDDSKPVPTGSLRRDGFSQTYVLQHLKVLSNSLRNLVKICKVYSREAEPELCTFASKVKS